MRKRLEIVIFLVLLALVAVGSALLRRVESPPHRPGGGKGAFDIQGVRLGMTHEEVLAVAGPALELGKSDQQWIYRSNRNFNLLSSVLFGADGRVRNVTGSTLSRDGKLELKNAAHSEAERLLGKPVSHDRRGNYRSWTYDGPQGEQIREAVFGRTGETIYTITDPNSPVPSPSPGH